MSTAKPKSESCLDPTLGHCSWPKCSMRASGWHSCVPLCPTDHQPQPMKHTLQKRDDELAFCTTCRGGEIDLPTECPGRPMTPAEMESIIDGTRDFINGGWVNSYRGVPHDGKARVAFVKARTQPT